MSPLQYQKVLRLHEARRLMLFHKMDAGEDRRCALIAIVTRWLGGITSARLAQRSEVLFSE